MAAAIVNRVGGCVEVRLSNICRPRKRRRQWASCTHTCITEGVGPCNKRTFAEDGNSVTNLSNGANSSLGALKQFAASSRDSEDARSRIRRTTNKLPEHRKARKDNDRDTPPLPSRDTQANLIEKNVEGQNSNRVGYDPLRNNQTDLFESRDERQDNDGVTYTPLPHNQTVVVPQPDEQWSLWQQLERMSAEEEEEDSRGSCGGRKEEDNSPNVRLVPATDKLAPLQIGTLEEIRQALIFQQPDRLIRAFIRVRHNIQVMNAIPDATFSEIIELLRPENLVRNLLEVHQDIGVKAAKQMGLMPTQAVVHDYLDVVLEIMAKRRHAGRTFSLSDYATLLSCARGVGDTKIAHALWSMMNKDDTTPDAACYHNYMAAIVWNDLHAESRRKSRVTEFNMLARIKKTPGPQFSNYRVWEGGIKATTMRLFNEMLANKVPAEEEAFCHVITGLAREGDIAGFERILERVWGIDVPDIMNDGDPELGVTHKPTSPLHPTDRLLFAVVHAFCINSDIPKAIRVGDYIMRKYKMEAPLPFWEQLLEFTYVASRASQTEEAVMPPESVDRLWETMIARPYHVQPSLNMYELMIKSMYRRGHRRMMYRYIVAALDLVPAAHEERDRAWFALLDAQSVGDMLEEGTTSREALLRDWEVKEVLRRRAARRARIWMRRLLYINTELHDINWIEGEEWDLETLPKLMKRHERFFPTQIWYETRAGVIEFKLRSEDSMTESAWRAADLNAEKEIVLDREPRALGRPWVAHMRSRKRLLRHGRLGW